MISYEVNNCLRNLFLLTYLLLKEKRENIKVDISAHIQLILSALSIIIYFEISHGWIFSASEGLL